LAAGSGTARRYAKEHANPSGQSASDEHDWPLPSGVGSEAGSDVHSTSGQQVSQQRPSAVHPVSDPVGGAQFCELSQESKHRASSAACQEQSRPAFTQVPRAEGGGGDGEAEGGGDGDAEGGGGDGEADGGGGEGGGGLGGGGDGEMVEESLRRPRPRPSPSPSPRTTMTATKRRAPVWRRGPLPSPPFLAAPPSTSMWFCARCIAM